MKSKNAARLRRAARTRRKIRELGAPRLCVHRTPKHIYVQLISPNASEVLACASTVEKDVRSKTSKLSGIDAAKLVGSTIAERVIKAGHKKVAFDRSGFLFHGRVKALADAAREAGLEF